MLIKLYTRGAVENLYIIENITQVRVKRCLSYESNLKSPYDIEPSKSYEHLDMTGEGFVKIEYEKEGNPLAIRVYNKAFICNDEGKTVEPVFVSQFFKEELESENTEESK